MPIVLRELRVLRTVRLTPRMVRLTVGGPQLRPFRATGYDLTAFCTQSPDDHVKLVLPDPGTGVLTLPEQDDGHLDWPHEPRPIHRDYTVRRFDPDAGEDGEVDIDLVLHDGVAGRWAAAAAPGDPIHVAGPRGSHLPDTGADWWVLAADETGLPAVARFVEEYAGLQSIEAFVVVDGPQEEHPDLPHVTWIHRPGDGSGSAAADLLAGAVRAWTPPGGRGWGWVGAEAGIVREVRKVYKGDLALSKDQIQAGGYWRRGDTLETAEDTAEQAFALVDLLTPYAVRAAVTLGVLDAVGEGTGTAKDVAARTGTDEHAVGLLLAHLCDIGAAERVDDDAYALTATGEMATDGTYGAEALDLDGPYGHVDRAWAGLADAVRTGRPGFETVFGRSYWDVVRADERLSTAVDAADAEEIGSWAAGVAARITELGAARVADVGGGRGDLLEALLAADPQRTGIVLEVPRGAEAATAHLAGLGLADRAGGVSCDFLTEVPSGFEVYVLARVLRDWPDHQARAILLNCARAAGPEGRVLVVEQLAETGAEDTRTSLMMLNVHGARLRTRDDLAALAHGAGLEPAEERPAGAGLTLVELVPATR